MSISIPAFMFYPLLMGPARAQVSGQVNAPNCTDSNFAWTFNSLQQNPCWITAYLAATCNNGTFSIPALSPQHSYTGPSGIDNGDVCKCNTVLYNLISACDACQGEPWISYSMWTLNCTTKEPAGNFPNPIPAVTRVPKWAYIDTSIGDTWNISAAQREVDSPEVTGTASIVPTSTISGSGSSSISTSRSSSNTGAIAGGVVGGIVGAALIAGAVLWFAIRRRRARSVPSAPYLGFQSDEKEQSPPQPLAIGAPKLYDPSDPTTYPSKEFLPMNNQNLGSTSNLRANDCGYRGLPEI